MDIDEDYNAVYAEAMARWTSDRTVTDGFSRRTSLGIGLRGKLTASDIAMKFDTMALTGDLAEDNITALVQLDCAWQPNNAQSIGLAYTGEFGQKLKSHRIWINFTQRF